MKLITFENKQGALRAGWLTDLGIVDMNLADASLPSDMLSFIDGHVAYFETIKQKGLDEIEPHFLLEDIQLRAPLPNPRSIRDYVAFEQHMLNASKSFGHQIGEAWYEMPIFYFTNHQAVYGPGDEIHRPDKEIKMDLELELAAIIGKKGKNIRIENAEEHIFGYTVFNDWTARSIQKREMEVPLGPQKGKDFANAFGPCIVTKDEFEKFRCTISREEHPVHLRMPPNKNHRFHLKMSARINGESICEGNYKTVHWTFPEMIRRASENHVTLMPGDILGSGTVGWGSLIENNFSIHRPLKPGDEVELEIEGIGALKNTVA